MTGGTATRDADLRARAARVIPGGVYGHQSVRTLPAGYPQFYARGQGAHLWDVDGRRYVDFLCGYGPNLLGYGHPEVEEAAARQRERGDCLTGPSEVMVELAERVVDTVAHADLALFAKNGTDATTICVTIARAHTGKRKVLRASGAYHGAAPWCTPIKAGVLREDRAHFARYEYDDIASLEAAVEQARGDLAAILVSPFRHDAYRDQQMPSRAFAARVRELCDAHGAALILDDVRAGLRLHEAGSWEPLSVRPDLSAFSKAIANGRALAVVTASEALRDAATRIYATGSFWFSAVAMAASLATLTIVRRDAAIERMARLGQRLRDGLAAQAERHGYGLRQTGPAQMPMMLFDDDPELARGHAFVAECAARGVLLHPWHNLFLCAAHTDADFDHALEVTDAALRALRERGL
jgi:glutamate-1-semialdehyde 2,1-aminomutase